MRALKASTLALVAVVLAAPAFGQGPGGFGQMTPEQRARMQQFQKWRDSHKNLMAVGRNLQAITYLESKPSTALTKDQAKKILAVLKTWRKKPAMTDDQAKQVNKQLTAPLNKAQITAMVTMPRRNRAGGGGGMGPGGGGGRPGGMGMGAGAPGGRPGGPGGPGGNRPRFQLPQAFNPLNPDGLPAGPMRERSKQRLDGLVTTLQAKAK